MKLKRISFLMLPPPLMVLSIPLQARHLTISSMGLTNAFLTMCSPVPLYSDEYSKLQLHCFQKIHNSVREKLKASREEVLRKQHLQAKSVNHDVGDSIMKRAHDRACKLTPNFTGPYLATAKILDPKNNISEIVYFDRLKQVSASFIPDAVPPTPLLIFLHLILILLITIG